MDAPVSKPADVSNLELLARVLVPYKHHCRYLQTARVSVRENEVDDVQVLATGELSIPESCYIDDTGHLNAVEFNICYNQLVYFAIASAVQGQLMPAFAGWSMDDFWRKQLPDILITRFESRFRRAVHPRRFYGEVALCRGRFSGSGAQRLLLMRTQVRFFDDEGGHCDGDVVLALVNPPAGGAAA